MKIQVIVCKCSAYVPLADAFWLVEELERLEQELEERGAEIERLQEEKTAALKELENQEQLQQSLRQQSQEQQSRQEELEMELDTKLELVCTRAFLFICADHNIQGYNVTLISRLQ